MNSSEDTTIELNIQDILLVTQSSDNAENFVKSHHPADIAIAIAKGETDEQIECFLRFPPKIAGEVLSELFEIEPSEELILLDKFPLDALIQIIENMPNDNAADILNTVNQSIRNQILESISNKKSDELLRLIAYPEDSAGGLMTTDYISTLENSNVEETISRIKKLKDPETAKNYRIIFVTDSEMRFIGAFPIIELLVHPNSSSIRDIMNRNYPSVQADLDQEKIANMFRKYDLVVLPVLNRGNKIIGRITVDDVFDVIHEEIDEDLYKLVGTLDTEKQTQNTVRIAAIRLPWLFSTLIGSFLCSTILKHYQVEMEARIALIFFVPLITAMSGNIGVQCSTLIVRGIATEHVNVSNIGSFILKEFKVALTMGLVLGIFSGLGSLYIERAFLVGLTVCISMFTCILFASISGTGVPFLLKKFKFDPAVASGPIITTFNDFSALTIYFTIANFIF